jgi:hypothetical protein
MVWKGIQGHDVMQQAGFCASSGLLRIQLSAGDISLFGEYPCNQLTKDPNHCFPTIMFDLDTSNELFWMVWKGI